MKLRPTRLSLLPALILLGSMMAIPTVTMGDGYGTEEDDQSPEHEMNDPYNQTDMQRTFQPMYDDTDEDEKGWDDREREEDEFVPDDSEDEDDMNGY